MTEQEQISFTCTDIVDDMAQTQVILDGLNSANAQAATGTAVGATALLATLGAVNFDLIGTPIAHAQAMHKTQMRLEQLHTLFDTKGCEQELMIELEENESASQEPDLQAPFSQEPETPPAV